MARVHTITIYMVDGQPKPSVDVLYMKKGESVRWESDVPDMDFQVTFDNKNKSGLEFSLDQTDVSHDNRFTGEHKAKGKFGKYKYNIQAGSDGPILDPSIDIGDPGP